MANSGASLIFFVGISVSEEIYSQLMGCEFPTRPREERYSGPPNFPPAAFVPQPVWSAFNSYCV